uniref:Uncharacterized protein n=1 Tax=Parascaris univalens TaxID=6257 RepID=A0A915B972_PARUN
MSFPTLHRRRNCKCAIMRGFRLVFCHSDAQSRFSVVAPRRPIEGRPTSIVPAKVLVEVIRQDEAKECGRRKLAAITLIASHIVVPPILRRRKELILRNALKDTMNELLAIIIIVVVCCAMFLAWLVSMATCPDRMVNLISGSKSSEYSSSHDSKELIAPVEGQSESLIAQNCSVCLQLNGSHRLTASKKLSMVPEADEQLTVTSVVPSVHQSILKASQLEKPIRSVDDIV